MQSASPSEAQPGAFRLYEAWLQQKIMSGRGGVKAGLIDINTTFDVQEIAALFLDAHRLAVKDWLSVRPDFQYVLRPHGGFQAANAVAVGLRFVFTYSR